MLLGNPLLVKGNPTPGLLSVTGQGVFKTDAKLAITCPNNVEPLPDKADANLFAAAGVRIQNFGREPSQRQDAALEIVASDMTCRICSREDSAFLTLLVFENENRLETLEIPADCLPADFVFGVNGPVNGPYRFTASSTARRQARVETGRSLDSQPSSSAIA